MAATDVAPAPACASLHDVSTSVQLHLVRDAHPALEAQRSFVERRARILTRSGVSGQRAISALHLVLDRHAAVAAVAVTGDVHLSCGECRPGDRAAAEQYPCPTASSAAAALDALLF